MTIHHPDYPSQSFAGSFDWAPLISFVTLVADIGRGILTLILAWACWIVVKSGHGPALVQHVDTVVRAFLHNNLHIG